MVISVLVVLFILQILTMLLLNSAQLALTALKQIAPLVLPTAIPKLLAR
jgi:hypothetical protein